MAIIGLVDKLEREVHRQFELFEKAEHIANTSSDPVKRFESHKEMAKINSNFDYLDEWIKTYNKIRITKRIRKD